MSARKGLFKKYPNPVFIETGSYGGEGIKQALDEGFKLIYSIELLPEWFEYCSIRFKNKPDVHLFLGDSAVILKGVMGLIDKPATFWLDGHIGAESTPLLQELEIIKQHKIKTHSILIDDLRDWKLRIHKFDTEILRQRLLEINPEYIIKREDGFKPNDILAARV